MFQHYGTELRTAVNRLEFAKKYSWCDFSLHLVYFSSGVEIFLAF